MIKLKEFCFIMNVSPSTVKRWQRKGYIPDRRDNNKRRYFIQEDIDAIRKIRGNKLKLYTKKSGGRYS